LKIKGQHISLPTPVLIIIPREGNDLIFYAQPIIDYSDFDTKAPEPTPPRVLRPGGVEFDDYDSQSYKESLERHGRLRWAWMIVKSLLATDGLEWETVNFNDPSTWEGYEKELKESGLTQSEVNYLSSQVAKANMLTEEKVEQARQRFFAKQQATPKK